MVIDLAFLFMAVALDVIKYFVISSRELYVENIKGAKISWIIFDEFHLHKFHLRGFC